MFTKTLLFASLLSSLTFTMPLAAMPLDTGDKPSVTQNTPARVNINQASAEQLADALHGVGIARARAIIELRESLGRFNHIDELLQVRGLSVRILEMNQDLIEL